MAIVHMKFTQFHTIDTKEGGGRVDIHCWSRGIGVEVATGKEERPTLDIERPA
jgi:hypothetical protein